MTDFPTFKSSLKMRFQGYFSAMTTQSYALDDFSETGESYFFSNAMNRRMAFPELPMSLQDIAFTAFILSILETISERWKGPVILDDPFVNVEEGILMGIGQSLKKLSSQTQVIHISSKGGFATLADNTISLG